MTQHHPRAPHLHRRKAAPPVPPVLTTGAVCDPAARVRRPPVVSTSHEGAGVMGCLLVCGILLVLCVLAAWMGVR